MIYVDEPKQYNTTLRYKVWSHMWSDECDQELHEMADRIGLKRGWFQCVSDKATDTMKRIRNHYDVTPRLRALAIHHGAIPLGDTDEVIRFLRKQLSGQQSQAFTVEWSRAETDGYDDDMLGDPSNWANVGPE